MIDITNISNEIAFIGMSQFPIDEVNIDSGDGLVPVFETQSKKL